MTEKNTVRMCQMLPAGNNPLCKRKATKRSNYCAFHNFILKHDKYKIKKCLGCGLGTWAKYGYCMKCGSESIRLKVRYQNVIKPFKEGVKDLLKIQPDLFD